jgi:hypothetical protein
VKEQNSRVIWRVVSPSSDFEIKDLLHELLRLNIINKLIEDKGLGVYHAMNQAVFEANETEWIWFLNAGDQFSSTTSYERIQNQIKEISNRWIFGGHILAAENGDVLGVRNAPNSVQPHRQLFAKDYVSHQGVVMNVGFIEELGRFNTQLKIAADWDLIVKACLVDPGFRIKEPLAIFYMGGLSTRGRQQSNLELRRLRSMYLGRQFILESYSWFAYRWFRNMLVMRVEGRFPVFLNKWRRLRLKFIERNENDV